MRTGFRTRSRSGRERSSITPGALRQSGLPACWTRHTVTEPLRVLVAGWLNSPHVAAWAEAVAAAGHDVHVVGRVVPNWPELELTVPSHRLATPWPPPVQGLRMSAGLRRVAAALEPDIVHAHYLPEHGWMAASEGMAALGL